MSTRRRILPVGDFGIASTNSTQAHLLVRRDPLSHVRHHLVDAGLLASL